MRLLIRVGNVRVFHSTTRRGDVPRRSDITAVDITRRDDFITRGIVRRGITTDDIGRRGVTTDDI